MHEADGTTKLKCIIKSKEYQSIDAFIYLLYHLPSMVESIGSNQDVTVQLINSTSNPIKWQKEANAFQFNCNQLMRLNRVNETYSGIDQQRYMFKIGYHHDYGMKTFLSYKFALELNRAFDCSTLC